MLTGSSLENFGDKIFAVLFDPINIAVEGNLYFALTTFVGSLLLAEASFWVLRHVAEPLKKKPDKRPRVNVSRQP